MFNKEVDYSFNIKIYIFLNFRIIKLLCFIESLFCTPRSSSPLLLPFFKEALGPRIYITRPAIILRFISYIIWKYFLGREGWMGNGGGGGVEKGEVKGVGSREG